MPDILKFLRIRIKRITQCEKEIRCEQTQPRGQVVYCTLANTVICELITNICSSNRPGICLRPPNTSAYERTVELGVCITMFGHQNCHHGCRDKTSTHPQNVQWFSCGLPSLTSRKRATLPGIKLLISSWYDQTVPASCPATASSPFHNATPTVYQAMKSLGYPFYNISTEAVDLDDSEDFFGL